MREAIKKVLAIAAERRDHPGLLEFVNVMVGYDLLTSPELNVLYDRMVPLDHAIILCHLQIHFAERLLQLVKKQYPWGKTLDQGDVIAFLGDARSDLEAFERELIDSLSAERCGMMPIFKGLHVHAACAFEGPAVGDVSPGLFDDGSRVKCVQSGGMLRIDFEESNLPNSEFTTRKNNFDQIKASIVGVIRAYRQWYSEQVQAYFDLGYKKTSEMKGRLAASIKQHKARLKKLQNEQAAWLVMLGVLESAYFESEKIRVKRLKKFLDWMVYASTENKVVCACYGLLRKGAASNFPSDDDIDDLRRHSNLKRVLQVYRIDPAETFDVGYDPRPVPLSDKMKERLTINDRYTKIVKDDCYHAEHDAEASLNLRRLTAKPLNAFAAFAMALDVSELSLRRYIVSFLTLNKGMYAPRYPGGVYKFDAYIESIHRYREERCPMEMDVMVDALGHLIVWVSEGVCTTSDDLRNDWGRSPIFMEQHDGQLLFPLCSANGLDAQALHTQLDNPRCRAVIMPHQEIDKAVPLLDESPDLVSFRIIASNGGVYPASAVAMLMGWDELVLAHALDGYLGEDGFRDFAPSGASQLRERYRQLLNAPHKDMFRPASQESADASADKHGKNAVRQPAVDQLLAMNEVKWLQRFFEKPIVILRRAKDLEAPRLAEYPHDPFCMIDDGSHYGPMILVDELQSLKACLLGPSPMGWTDHPAEGFDQSPRSPISPEGFVRIEPEKVDSDRHTLLHLAMLYANAAFMATLLGPATCRWTRGYIRALPPARELTWVWALAVKEIVAVKHALVRCIDVSLEVMVPLIQNRIDTGWSLASTSEKKDVALQYLEEAFEVDKHRPSQLPFLHPLLWHAYATIIGVQLYLWIADPSEMNKLVPYVRDDVGERAFASQPEDEGSPRIDLLMDGPNGEAVARIRYVDLESAYPKKDEAVYPSTYELPWNDKEQGFGRVEFPNSTWPSLTGQVSEREAWLKEWRAAKQRYNRYVAVHDHSNGVTDEVEKAIKARFNNTYWAFLNARNAHGQLFYKMHTEDGNTALHYLIQMNQLPVIPYLVEHGANVMASNRYGVKPCSMYDLQGQGLLHHALKEGHRGLLFSMVSNDVIDLAMPMRQTDGKPGRTFMELLTERLLNQEAPSQGVVLNRESMDYQVILCIEKRHEHHRTRHRDYQHALAAIKQKFGEGSPAFQAEKGALDAQYSRSERMHSSPIYPGTQGELREWSAYELDVDGLAMTRRSFTDPGIVGRFMLFGTITKSGFERSVRRVDDAHERNRARVVVSFFKQDDRLIHASASELGLFDSGASEALRLYHHKAENEAGYAHCVMKPSVVRAHMNREKNGRSMAEKKTKLEEAKRLLEEAKGNVKDANGGVIEAQARLDAVLAKVSDAEKDVTAVKSELRAAKAELRVEESDQKCANLSGVSDPSFDTKIELAKLAVDEAEKQLQAMKAVVEKAKADIAPAEAKVRAQEAEVRRAEEEVVSAQARVAEKETEVEAMKAEVAQLEADHAGRGAEGNGLFRSNGRGSGSAANLALPSPSIQ